MSNDNTEPLTQDLVRKTFLHCRVENGRSGAKKGDVVTVTVGGVKYSFLRPCALSNLSKFNRIFNELYLHPREADRGDEGGWRIRNIGHRKDGSEWTTLTELLIMVRVLWKLCNALEEGRSSKTGTQQTVASATKNKKRGSKSRGALAA